MGLYIEGSADRRILKAGIVPFSCNHGLLSIKVYCLRFLGFGRQSADFTGLRDSTAKTTSTRPFVVQSPEFSTKAARFFQGLEINEDDSITSFKRFWSKAEPVSFGTGFTSSTVAFEVGFDRNDTSNDKIDL